MAKILLVEDDNNLREIYEARLMAEGYEIVSARDGEEALSVAMKEKPDLIISDVMMPKISGFDMLDILRNTEETKNAKVIMMTALSQAEDKARAKKLGADRYLVKSQVTLEDVARVAKEVLDGVPAPEEPTATEPNKPAEEVKSAAAVVAAAAAETDDSASVKTDTSIPAPAPSPATAPVANTAAPEPVVASTPAPEPVVTTPTELVTSAPVPEPIQDSGDDTKTEETIEKDESDIEDKIANQTNESPTVVPSTPNPEPVVVTPEEPQAVETPKKTSKKVISPINDVNVNKADHLNKLAEKEAAIEEAAKNPQVQETAPPTQTPEPAPSPAPADDNIDPNSIAL